MKVLIAVTHLLGAGHLSRAMTLARAFASAEHNTTVISGGRPTPHIDTAGSRLVQLPPLASDGTRFTTLLDTDGHAATPAYRLARAQAMTATLREIAPDVLITELFPFGRRALAPEFLALLEAAQDLPHRPVTLASIRDILAPPSNPDKAARTHDIIARHYDAVLVHSDPDVTPLETSWPVDASLAPKLRYTGYVAPPASAPHPGRAGLGEVLVSAGGGPVGQALFDTALAAARHSVRPWRLLVGGEGAEVRIAALNAAAPANVTVEGIRRDFRAMLHHAAASLSLCGYNTALDLLQSGVPAVLVPFDDGGEVEQTLRARALAHLPAMESIASAALTPQTLSRALEKVIAEGRRTPGTLRDTGAADSVRIAADLAGARPPAPRAPRAPAFDWTPLRDEWAAWRAAGLTCPIWWRDDDTATPTPALERLAALSDESGVPLHLALIPAQATPALADWIADRPDTIPLIHGWSHDNHAPEGAKKAEFGQPRAEAAADLRRARDRLRALFGARLAPVFVPPWNRFDASLPPVLTALGLRALSAFTPRAAPQAAPGLARINTHVDPIDWRGTRDLIAPGTLIAQTAGLLRERREGCADNAEPFGLLTHHLAHDALVWDFCRQYLLEMRAGPTALWRADRDLPAREDTT